MDITIAYFHPLLRPDVVKQDFEQIRLTGASSILYTFHEQEEQRSPRDFERGLRQAREAGLKINLGLGRYGNLFAGPALVPSWYTFRHPQSRVMDQHGRYHESTCFNHQGFRAWLSREIVHYLTNYPISGILFEEPGGLDVTCYCPACRALCPDVTDLERFRRRSMIAFLGDLCAHVKQIDERVKTTIVLRPQDLSLLEDLVGIAALDTLGCHVFWNILREHVTRVEQWGNELVEAARTSGKRSQLWLQNFNLDMRVEEEMEEAFATLLKLEPDEIGTYYYWRNNEDPARAWETTRRLLRHVPRRQMHWQTASSVTPVTPATSATLRFPAMLPSKPVAGHARLAAFAGTAAIAEETLVIEQAPVSVEAELSSTPGARETAEHEAVSAGTTETEPEIPALESAAEQATEATEPDKPDPESEADE